MKHSMMDVSKEFRTQNKNSVAAINPLYKKSEETKVISMKAKEMDIQAHIAAMK